MSNQHYSPKQFANMIGCSVRTLQKWDVDGTFVSHRNPKNRRYYTHDQYLKYIGVKADDSKKTIVYCRVSSNGQKNDLLSQKKALEQYCAAFLVAYTVFENIKAILKIW